MTEQYSGVKFLTIFEEKLVPLHNVEAEELIEWCRLFAKKGLSTRIGKGFSGNLSFRTKKGFVITDEPGIYFIPALIDLWKKENKFTQ